MWNCSVDHLEERVLCLNLCIEYLVWNVHHLNQLGNLVKFLTKNPLSSNDVFDLDLKVFISHLRQGNLTLNLNEKNVLFKELICFSNKVRQTEYLIDLVSGITLADIRTLTNIVRQLGLFENSKCLQIQ
jgi:hypothetical protein